MPDWMGWCFTTGAYFTFGFLVALGAIRAGYDLRAMLAIFGLASIVDWIARAWLKPWEGPMPEWYWLILLFAAGIAFCEGNLYQFFAAEAAPLPGYATIIIAVIIAIGTS